MCECLQGVDVKEQAHVALIMSSPTFVEKSSSPNNLYRTEKSYSISLICHACSQASVALHQSGEEHNRSI